jgi:glycosyltransferase involved in cell wall biosynthesis
MTQNINIIIPTYNRASLLKRAIDSVLEQTRSEFELIVVDDGSNDNTQELLKSYGSHITVLTQEHRGVSATRNLGIAHSTNDWIAFLDSDDEWKPHKLEHQLSYIQEHPTCKICQTEEDWIRNGKGVNPKNKHQKPSGWIFEESLKLCLVSPSSVMIHREVFETVGVFDEDFPACEDYDLWLRIALHYPIDLITESCVIKYGGHEDQLSRSIWGLDRFRIQAMEKLLGNPALSKTQRSLLITELHNKLDIMIKGCQNRGKGDALRLYLDKKSMI